jgi:uncharacterized protein DUF397
MTDVSPAWERPARCHATQACVELARDEQSVALRNSSEPGTVVRYTREEFALFVEAVKSGQFDRLA